MIISSLLGGLVGWFVIAAFNRRKPKISSRSSVYRYSGDRGSRFDDNVVIGRLDHTVESTMESEMVVHEVFGVGPERWTSPFEPDFTATGGYFRISFGGFKCDRSNTLFNQVKGCEGLQNVVIAPGSEPYELRVGCKDKDYLEMVIIPTIKAVLKQKGKKKCQVRGEPKWSPRSPRVFNDTDDDFP
jgi:hypothetical protein